MRSKSPSLSPKPVKSNRNTAMFFSIKVFPMVRTAVKFLLHVKQCANKANAFGVLFSGNSSRAAKVCPLLFLNFTFLEIILQYLINYKKQKMLLQK